jgi:hypothetical protein
MDSQFDTRCPLLIRLGQCLANRSADEIFRLDTRLMGPAETSPVPQSALIVDDLAEFERAMTEVCGLPNDSAITLTLNSFRRAGCRGGVGSTARTPPASILLSGVGSTGNRRGGIEFASKSDGAMHADGQGAPHGHSVRARPPCADRYVSVVQQSPLSNPMLEAPPVPIAHGLVSPTPSRPPPRTRDAPSTLRPARGS